MKIIRFLKEEPPPGRDPQPVARGATPAAGRPVVGHDQKAPPSAAQLRPVPEHQARADGKALKDLSPEIAEDDAPQGVKQQDSKKAGKLRQDSDGSWLLPPSPARDESGPAPPSIRASAPAERQSAGGQRKPATLQETLEKHFTLAQGPSKGLIAVGPVGDRKHVSAGHLVESLADPWSALSIDPLYGLHAQAAVHVFFGEPRLEGPDGKALKGRGGHAHPAAWPRDLTAAQRQYLGDVERGLRNLRTSKVEADIGAKDDLASRDDKRPPPGANERMRASHIPQGFFPATWSLSEIAARIDRCCNNHDAFKPERNYSEEEVEDEHHLNIRVVFQPTGASRRDD